MSNFLKFCQAFHAAPVCSHFLAGYQELSTNSTKATKGAENAYEDFFVFFVSFVVKLIFGCGRTLRCSIQTNRGTQLNRGERRRRREIVLISTGFLCALCGEKDKDFKRYEYIFFRSDECTTFYLTEMFFPSWKTMFILQRARV
jgi:hypothetical protein